MQRVLPLFLALTGVFFLTGLMAQVGVNNPNPVQALDVNGKIRVGDDATLPDDGTVRYNDGAQDLEGYVDGTWKSLTESGTPVAPEPVAFAHFGVANNSTWVEFDRRYEYASSDPANNITSTVVPEDKIFVVDQICATQSSGDADTYFYASVRPADIINGNSVNQNPQLVIGGSRKDGSTCMESERAPLMVIPGGNTIRVWNSTDSGGEIRVMVYGFFVDDLDDYFSY